MAQFGALLGVIAAIGSFTTTEVATVTRPTTASPEAVWALWADVPQRTRWDPGLEWARIDGPFREGATGAVKVEGQPERRFQLVEVSRPTAYTDRFFLPAGARMDWEHDIEQRGDGRSITFRVRVKGPTSLMLAPIVRSILNEELPGTVDQLVRLAGSQILIWYLNAVDCAATDHRCGTAWAVTAQSAGTLTMRGPSPRWRRRRLALISHRQ